MGGGGGVAGAVIIKNGCTRISNSTASQGTIKSNENGYPRSVSKRKTTSGMRAIAYVARIFMVDIFTDFNDHRSSTVSVYVPKVIEARDEIQMAPESQESPQTPAVSMSEDVVRKECECQQKIDRLQERVRKLEEQSAVERFGVRRFMASDSDMRFYTGLPDY